MPTIITRASSPAIINDSLPVPPAFPEIPEEIKRRFPSAAQWEDDMGVWWTRTKQALTDMNDETATVINQVSGVTKQTKVVSGALSAEILTEQSARIAGDTALASSISSVTAAYQAADTTLQSNITTEITARTNGDNTLASQITSVTSAYQAADTTLQSNITSEATTRANADSTLSSNITSVTSAYQAADTTLQANITAEASTRAGADGNLAGKYTLTVTAGDVVTGMNITSASGPGSNISSVTFQTDRFLIWGGSAGKQIFSATAGAVLLGNVLTVDLTNSKLFMGTGTYADSGTAFYVDSTGKFSLKDKLQWDGSALTITGSGSFSGAITASSGTFNGTVNASAGYFGSGSSVVSIGSGGLDVGTGGYIKGGASGYDSGTGFWLGYSSGYKFFVGNSGGDKITFDGSSLTIKGIFDVGSGGSRVRIDSSQMVYGYASGFGTVTFSNNGTNQVSVSTGSTYSVNISGGSAAAVIQVLAVATTKFSANDAGVVNCTGHYEVNGTQVVGPRGSAIPTVTYTGTYTSDGTNIVNAINSIIARLQGHGLIG